jgi:drug/metabolite transporter (DMT)-like permease
MPNYGLGIFTALLAPISHAWSNIIDSQFSNHVFPRLSVLVLFSMLFNLALLPIIVIISPPHFVAPPLLGLIFCISLIEVLYLFPYYWSLKRTDTSVVASLFSVGEVAVPILAFFFLHERLAQLQYVGFALVIISAIALTLDLKKLRLDASFFFMLAASLILAIEAILYKFVYLQGVSWGTVMVAGTFFQVLIILPLALRSGLGPIREGFSKARSAGWLFLGNEFLGSVGNLGNSFALSAIPVTIVKAIGATQPAFVLGYAYLFRKKHSAFFKEKVSRSDAFRKVFFFALTVIGVLLVVT